MGNKKNAWLKFDNTKKEEIFSFCEGYKKYISDCKTERESIKEAIYLAKSKGYRDLKNVISAGKSLKAFWKEDYDQAVEGEKQILSLLSSEFEQVFSKAIRERMIRIKFMENRGGTLKIHSTISKKARGAMVTAMMKEEIIHLEDLKSLEVAGFSYREDLSQEKEWVFVKE